MALEAAVNRLEALVEKVDSDLNYAVLKLANEFGESFEEDLPSQVNPVGLIERVHKAKEDFDILMKESEEVETKQKAASQELCRLTSEEMNKADELQLRTGIQPDTSTTNEDLPILHQKSSETGGKHNSVTRSSKSDFQPVTDEEFMSISDLVRGRLKLHDVNQVYETLFTYFKKNRKASGLTLKEMTKLGLKVTGATGGAKLKLLGDTKKFRKLWGVHTASDK